ncbi:MAG TPA: ribosome maturation factor RimM [Candidatus Limnocylindrales bacterium]
MPALNDERLVVALVRGVHGLRGAVRVEVLTDHPAERFAPGAVLHREGDDAPLTIVSAVAIPDGPGWRLQFREVLDRSAADTLRGAYLEAALPAAGLARGEYYWHEIIGTPVTDVAGRALGTVRDMYRAGGAEVMVVAGGPLGEFDVPAVRAFVRIFAPKRGEIVVDAEALDLAPVRHGVAAPDRAPRKARKARPRREDPALDAAATGDAGDAAETAAPAAPAATADAGAPEADPS